MKEDFLDLTMFVAERAGSMGSVDAGASVASLPAAGLVKEPEKASQYPLDEEAAPETMPDTAAKEPDDVAVQPSTESSLDGFCRGVSTGSTDGLVEQPGATCYPRSSIRSPFRRRKQGSVTWAPSPQGPPVARRRLRQLWLPLCARMHSVGAPPQAAPSPVPGSSPECRASQPHTLGIASEHTESTLASYTPGSSASPPSVRPCGKGENHICCRNNCCQAFRPGGEMTKTDRLVRRIRQERARRELVVSFLEKHGFEGLNKPRRQALGFSHWYPLHCAVARNDASMVKSLLRLGADPKLRDGGGFTAYERAQRQSRKTGEHHAVLAAFQGKSKDVSS